MESGYKLFWTQHALNELQNTYGYLQENFTDRELKALSNSLNKTLILIQQNPNLFPLSEFAGIRRVVIKKYNNLYYLVEGDSIKILSFFSNRQNPKLKKV